MTRGLLMGLGPVALLAACGARTGLTTIPPPAGGDAGDGGDSATEVGPDVTEADVPGDACGRPGGVVVLANEPMRGGDVPPVVALDDTQVYFWVNPGHSKGKSGAILAVRKCGGPVSTLATQQDSPSGLAADGTFVYWSNASFDGNGAVLRVPAGGGTVSTVAIAYDPLELAVDASNVYWTDPILGQVMSAPSSGGAAVTLATLQHNPQSIALDADNVYFTNAGDSTGPSAVVQVPKGGGTAITLTTGTFLYGVAVDATYAYYGESSNNGAATLNRVPLGGGTPASLASFTPYLGALTVDDSSVYWTDNNGGSAGAGTLLKVAKAGGTTSTLASGQSGPDGIAVDGTSVYFTNDLVELVKVGK